VNRESNTDESPGLQTGDDWACVQRVQRGETDAFENLVLRHQKTIFNLVYRMLSDYDEAAEIAQEAFLSAFKSIGQFRGEASFSTWLFRIALNHATNRRKTLTNRQRHTVPLDQTEPVDHRFPDPAKFAESRQTRSLVQEALNKLSPEHCEIVVLIDMQGVSYEDAADAIGIKIETVKTRLHRARQALKAQLAPVFKDRGSR
jgi:RNA polymerase sigma-70 factor (ECF subfamily)